ncbi:Transcription initiation factor TFIID subunit 12 [Frankliniella fusca]|uniref:Transcription initiation factor TFIID subunit 12 n=1 Tax=Frankliniella fusca TaxID=407009 RepID=A0AAE1HSV5_9NEOP|nr:Transcription initiation factor TFIID subunit 12 [Frankliniella fusca]
MSLPSLDPSQSLDLPAQPPPLLPTGALPTPMDTTPTPVIASSLPTTTTIPAMQLGNVMQTANSQPSTANSSTPIQGSSTTKNQSSTSSAANSVADAPAQLLSKARLQDLVREIDPTVQLDDEVEELLMQLADDFVETAVNSASLLAKHRKASTIDVKDVQLHLERNWNMWIPGFGNDEIRPFKRAAMTEAHKQRLALIKKTLKKY